MAARQLSVGPSDLMSKKDWAELGQAASMRFSDLDEAGRPTTMAGSVGQRAQSIYYLRRSLLKSCDAGALMRDIRFMRSKFAMEVSRFQKMLDQYKQERGKVDYADLLDDAPVPSPRIVILDEAQDLTPQQWRYFSRLVEGAEKVYLGGDDEQSIFQWAGADVRKFLAVRGDREVLGISHRLPRAVYALARDISSRIIVKQAKEWRASEREGSVKRNVGQGELDLSQGTWLLLVRTRNQLPDWVNLCRSKYVRYIVSGVDSVKQRDVDAIHAWGKSQRGLPIDEFDSMLIDEYAEGKTVDMPWYAAMTKITRARRDYYRGMLSTHGRAELETRARIRIDTIHGAKGAEADHVAVFPDITRKIYDARRIDPDSEHRVWYVAVTRARHSLHLMRRDSNLFYPM